MKPGKVIRFCCGLVGLAVAVAIITYLVCVPIRRQAVYASMDPAGNIKDVRVVDLDDYPVLPATLPGDTEELPLHSIVLWTFLGGRYAVEFERLPAAEGQGDTP